MSLAPESIEVGRCYLEEGYKRRPRVRRVLHIRPDGRVQYEYRQGRQANSKTWKPGMQELGSFAAHVAHEVPCDWTPETGE